MRPLSSDRTGRDAVPDGPKARQAQSCALREARDFSRVRLHSERSEKSGFELSNQ